MVLDACSTVMELVEGVFVWGEDVLNSPFRPARNALFLVELILDGQGERAQFMSFAYITPT